MSPAASQCMTILTAGNQSPCKALGSHSLSTHANQLMSVHTLASLAAMES